MPPSSPPPAREPPPSWTDDRRAPRDGADDSGRHAIVLEEGSLLANKYRLSRPAGFGGMAQLWVAQNESTGAEVCIKILVPAKSDDESVERFRREAYAAARLTHRAIVRIFDLVELGPDGAATAGKPAALAIVMELLHGETLGDVLMKRGKLPLDEAIDLTLPVLSALAHAHRAGVVHRDLKPDNIFLATDPDGHVIPKVLDFGVSKVANAGDPTTRSTSSKPITLDGVMLGTPSFMSPEQARGARDVDARSDVFSAGILLYVMLAGTNPFESESFDAVLSAVIERDPPRLLGVPDAIWAVLERSLAKDAKARFADATEVGIALRRASGRTATTESGQHLVEALPLSMRQPVPPLGGDSHVSVPPVGNAELGDTSGDPPRRTVSPAARRRRIGIVLGAVAVSVVVTVVALLRSPSRPAAPSGVSATGDLPGSAVPIVGTAAPGPATASGAAATGTGAAATAAATGDRTGDRPKAVDAGVPAARTGGAAGPAKKKDAPRGPSIGTPLTVPTGPTRPKEPSMVRDPGF